MKSNRNERLKKLLYGILPASERKTNEDCFFLRMFTFVHQILLHFQLIMIWLKIVIYAYKRNKKNEHANEISIASQSHHNRCTMHRQWNGENTRKSFKSETKQQSVPRSNNNSISYRIEFETEICCVYHWVYFCECLWCDFSLIWMKEDKNSFYITFPQSLYHTS